MPILGLTLLSIQAVAQTLETSQVLPPSPEASSLTKFIETPVNYYTGVPQISIPIYELKGRSLSLPIGLSYHSGGIKVEEIASRVGLGWTLFAGGSISRTVKGLPDEDESSGGSGFMFHDDNARDILGMINSPDVNVRVAAYQDILDKKLDFEPDEFHLSAPGVSSKFYVDADYSTSDPSDYICRPIPYKNVDISFNLDNIPDVPGPENDVLASWVVKDDQGNTYYFGRSKDGTRSAIDIVYKGGRSNEFNYINSGPAEIPTSWHLMDIESVNGDMIHFEYSAYGSSYCLRSSGSKYALVSWTDQPLGAPPSHSAWRSIEHKGYVVKKIWNDSFEVQFSTIKDENDNDVERLDLPVGAAGNLLHTQASNLPSNRALQFISVFNKTGNLLKKVKLTTSYFIGSGGNTPTSPQFCYDDNARNHRLRLDKVEDVTDPLSLIPPYVFEYDNTKLPDRISYQRDHWGYYNGASLNDTYIPAMSMLSTLDPERILIFPGANRMPNIQYTGASILTEITHPTGGKTTYEYEQNDYSQIASNYRDEIGTLTPPLETIIGTVSETNQNLNFQINGPYVPELGQSGEFVKITVGTITPCDPTQIIGGCGGSITLNQENVVQQNANGEFQTIYKFLPNGSYDLTLFVYDLGELAASGLQASIYKFIQNSEYGASQNIAGGVRIKRMATSPNDGTSPDLIKNYSYLVQDPSTQEYVSSGVLYHIPRYSHYTRKIGYRYSFGPICATELSWDEAEKTINISQNCSSSGSFVSQGTSFYHVRTDNSLLPISFSSGSPVEYRSVEVTYGANGEEGKDIYEYTTSLEYDDIYDPLPDFDEYPYPPPTIVDWKRGLLKNHKSYKFISGNTNGYVLVREQISEYEFNDNPSNNPANRYSITGVLANCTARGPSIGQPYCYPDDCCKDVNFVPYKVLTEWFHQKKVTTRMYNSDDPTKFVETLENFTFGNPQHGQMTKSAMVNSDGIAYSTEYYYPTDYTVASGNPIDQMQIDFMHSMPIEVLTKRGNQVIGGSFTEYAIEDNNIVVRKIHQLKQEGASSGYTPPKDSHQPTTVYEPRVDFPAYNAYGQLLQQEKTGDLAKTYYVWGYNQTLPVAKIVSIDLNIGAIESLQNSIQNLTGNALIAALAQLRDDADNFVTTYTYNERLQVATITDPNGFTVTYEYDGLGRLLQVTDHKGNTVQENEYNYKQGGN